ncbi:MAG TPA: 4-hydroxy-tetrahydrodipicolinate reductase [Syntrophomonadaceae bacterium]|nr:4-hydroxy-tetrahydrodipicolinate reductase [Syntrophomonadaceae bacterium]
MARRIQVMINGALGKMGRETIKAVTADPELQLMGMVDLRARGETLSQITGSDDPSSLVMENDLELFLGRGKPDIVIDFTNPQVVFENVRSILQHGVSCVVGTTGLGELELKQLEQLAGQKGVGVAVIPNFAIGAVLMMKFASEASRYFPDVEIIELHHDQKMDSPSGTSIKTAELINRERSLRPPRGNMEVEKIPGCRGGDADQVRIHSVRLPGFVAHQEVIFGGVGQSLTIRHDSYDRVGFMPGVIMVVKKMTGRKGLIYGMENLL